MAQGSPPKPNKKVANSLVAMSSAAVLAVYAAGFTRTRSAADRLDAQTAQRRPAIAPSSGTEALPAEHSPGVPPSHPEAVSSLPAGAADEAKPAVAEVSHMPTAPAAAETAPVAPHPKSPSQPVPAQIAEAPVAPAVELKADSAPPTPAVAPVPTPAPVPAPQPPAPVAPAPAAPAWKDGTYLGWGTSRHGDIQASVVIEGGRIASATIAQCWTRYSCNVISQLPPQVAQRQSPEVDFVSGATQSANAFYYGVVDALSKAK